MSDKLNIRLNIAGKSYPLNIDREKEEKYRRAEREVNALVETFKKRFRAEESDYLAMAALQLAVSCVETEMNRNRDEVAKSLQDIESQLDKYLTQIK